MHNPSPHVAALTAQRLAQELDAHSRIFTLVQGQGKWAYLEIPPSNYEAFLQAQQNPHGYTPSHYGSIRAHGTGTPPPIEALQRQITTMHFGFQTEFTEMMREAKTWAERLVEETKRKKHLTTAA